VQAAALVSQNNIGEDRRTCEAIAMTSIVRPANAAALQLRNEQRTKDGKAEIKQVQGCHKVGPSLDIVDQFMRESKRAKKLLGDDEYKRLVQELGTSNSKQSAESRASQMRIFKKSLEKPRKVNKAEKPIGHDITAAMGGGILLRILTKKNNTLEAVHAEMKARHIPMTRDQEERWTIAAKCRKLRLDELGKLCR
jgi:hypothetical protein